MRRAPFLVLALLSAALPAIGCGGGGDDPRATPDALVDAPVDAPEVHGPLDVTIRTYPHGLPGRGDTANARMVAFQDGDGAWTSLSGTAGVYHAVVTGTRYGVAVGCLGPGGGGSPANVWVRYQTLSEAREVNIEGCSLDASNVIISATVTGLADTERCDVWAGDGLGLATTEAPAEVWAARGPVDVLVKTTITLPDNRIEPVRFYRPPTVDTTGDPSASVSVRYDLGALGVDPERHAFTVIGRDSGETLNVHSSYSSPASMVQWPLHSGSGTDGYVTLAAAGRRPSDVSNITLLAASVGSAGRSYVRIVRAAMNPPIEPTLTLPAPWDAAAPVVDAAAPRRARFTVPLVPGRQPHLTYVVTASSVRVADEFVVPQRWSILASSGWIGAGTSAVLETPDLRALPGWADAMAIGVGRGVDWTVSRIEHNLEYDAIAVDGRRWFQTQVQGQLAP